MPRTARIVVEEVPCHVTQQGNNRQDIFFVAEDYKAYLDILKEQAEKYGLSILGYCLMTNHIHLICTPQESDSLAKAVGRAGFIYTQYINRFHNRSGHLWQGRFYSCALDDKHLLSALRYIECNPVRAKIVRRPWEYEWSSAAAHVGKGIGAELVDLAEWRKERYAGRWKDLLMERVDDKELIRIRGNTHTGRPLGSDSFISKLEKMVGRRLRPLPVGRPKNEIRGENR